MSGLFVGTEPLKKAFVGTQPVKSIWVGDRKIWPTAPEEIMYTVTSTVMSASGSNEAITNLSWLPDGPAATTIPLTARKWLMLVWRATGKSWPNNDVQFGVRTNTGDQLTTTLSPTGSPGIYSLEFTLATAQDITFIGKAQFANRDFLSPGDVIAFAPRL